MSSIKLSPNASGTGALTIAAPNTNTDVTFNLGTALGNNGASALVSTDNAGNLGLGVTPSAWGGLRALQIANASWFGLGNSAYSAVNAYYDGSIYRYISTGFACRTITENGQFQWFTAPSGTAGNAISFTQAMTLDASSNLSVGTTAIASSGQSNSLTTGAALAVKGILQNHTTAALILDYNSNRSTLRAYGATAGSGLICFNVGGGNNSADFEAARITSGGLFLCGTTSAPTSIAGTIGAVGYATRSGVAGGSFSGNNFNINWTGSAALWIDNTNLGNIQLSSDYRIKKNIETQPAPALERVMRLRPVTYELADYGNLFKADGVQREGFIAHEVQEVIPSGAEGQKDEEGRIQNLRTDAILSVAVKAIQEQQMLIEDQRAIITAQQSALESLTARVAALEGTQA